MFLDNPAVHVDITILNDMRMTSTSTATATKLRSQQRKKSSANPVGIKLDGTPNQAVRVILILRYLHDNHAGLTVTKIITRLDEDHQISVDRRQIYRDIEYIKKAGVKLDIAKDGAEITYSIPANQRVLMVRTMAEALPLAMEFIKALAPQAAEVNMTTLTSDVDQLLKIEGGGEVLANTELMHSIHSGTWERNVRGEILTQTFAAVRTRRWHILRYGSITSREVTVFPCKITLYLGRMYLIAFVRDKQQYFVYALDKIIEIRQEPGSRRPRHKFEADEFMKTRWGIWSSINNPNNPSNTYNVEVQIIAEEAEKHKIKEFVERMWHPSQKVECINDLTYRMTFESGVSSELVSWVLRWAPHVKVIKPKFLKDEVRKRAQKLMEDLG